MTLLALVTAILSNYLSHQVHCVKLSKRIIKLFHCQVEPITLQFSHINSMSQFWQSRTQWGR